MVVLEVTNFGFQHTDDPELWAELKRKEVDYEKRRNKKVQYYESVKHAQSVQIDDIPLPQMSESAPSAPTQGSGGGNLGAQSRIPLPPTSVQVAPYVPNVQQSILKKPPEVREEKVPQKGKKDTPGCPPGPPPNLLEMRELDDDYDEEPKPKKIKSIRFSDEHRTKEKPPPEVDDESLKPTSLQQRILALSGQNIDEFMKEMESVQKKKEQEKTGDAEEPAEEKESEEKTVEEPEKEPLAAIPNPKPPHPPRMSLPPLGLSPAQQNLLFRPPPPPLRPGMPGMSAIRMPPPPPGMPPRMGIRMPPGPPMGPPPRHSKGHHHQHNPLGGNILSAGPQLVSSKDPKSATITAKPQIRNLSADVTRFLPAALRGKREEKQKSKPPQVQHTQYSQFAHSRAPSHEQLVQMHPSANAPAASGPAAQKKGPTKDDAYMQFMKEMQGLL